MIGIVVHLEDRWNYTQSDRDIDVVQMYEETVKALNADTFIIVDKTTGGMLHNFESIDITYGKYGTLAEVLAAYPDATKLYFEHTNGIPAGAEYMSLDELAHPPDNVLYIVGGDECGLNFGEIALGENDKIVSILVSKYILWTLATITMVMYDRHMKVS